MGYLVKSGKLKKVPGCSVSWSADEKMLERSVAEIVNQLIQQRQGGATNDTEQEEKHEMMSPSL